MEGVAARLNCPEPPDPNGPAPNPPMAGDLVSATFDYAPGNGEPTPERAACEDRVLPRPVGGRPQ